MAPESVDLVAKLSLGEPQASVSWYKNGTELLPGDKYTMSCQDEVSDPPSCLLYT